MSTNVFTEVRKKHWHLFNCQYYGTTSANQYQTVKPFWVLQ